MKPAIYNEGGFYHTLLTSLLIMAVALVTQFKKELFVHETGHFSIFGSLGIVFAAGLLLKWRGMREIVAVLSIFVLMLLVLIAMFSDRKFMLSYVVLGCAVAVIVGLTLSNEVKHYTGNRRDKPQNRKM